MAEPLHILAVDDETFIRVFVRDVFETVGHIVQTAASGAEAIETFRAGLAAGEGFDIVITDLAMPDGDGGEVARVVKAEAPGTPVLLLTAWGWTMTDEKNVPDGVDLVLDKPVKAQDLRNAVACLIAERNSPTNTETA